MYLKTGCKLSTNNIAKYLGCRLQAAARSSELEQQGTERRAQKDDHSWAFSFLRRMMVRREQTKGPAVEAEPFFFFYSISSGYHMERINRPKLFEGIRV
jgi:hypothetical protein